MRRHALIFVCLVGVFSCGRVGFDLLGTVPGDDAGPVEADAQILPASCSNGELDGLETDIDCGGAECTPCEDGRVCVGPLDCLSRACLDQACQPPRCDDGIRNGNEDAIDCGGDVCAPCPENLDITFGAGFNEAAYGVDILASGRIVVVGATADLGGDGSAMVAATDSLGNGLYNHRIGAERPDTARAVTEDDAGRIIVAGQSYSFGDLDNDPYLMALDPTDGSIVVSQISGSPLADAFYGVARLADGRIVAVGETRGFGATGIDVLVQVFDPELRLVWSRRYGGPGDDIGWAVTATSDGGAAIVGTTTSFGQGGADVLVVRVAGDGGLLWSASYGGPGDETAAGVAQTLDGGLVIAADTTSYGAGSTDLYVIRLDDIGNLLWADAYGGADAELAGDVRVMNDGDIVVVGSTASMGAGGYDLLLVRMSSGGALRWLRPIGGAANDLGRALDISGQSIAVAGVTESFGGEGQQMYLVRLGTDGDNMGVCGHVGSATMIQVERNGVADFIGTAGFDTIDVAPQSVPMVIEYTGPARPECTVSSP